MGVTVWLWPRNDGISTKFGVLFNIFAMAEVAMAVLKIRYYIEKPQILM